VKVGNSRAAVIFNKKLFPNCIPLIENIGKDGRKRRKSENLPEFICLTL